MILSLTKATRAGVLTRFTPKSLSRTQRRCLTLHSYQTQDLLRASGILVPRGVVARTPLEVRDAVKSLGRSCTLQAQVLWGHKDSLSFEDGLRGGSQKVQDPEQGMSMAGRMLNSRVVSDGISHQSITANQILVSEVMAHQELWHLSMTIDRENYCPAIIISKLDGNTNIEGSVIQENSQKSSTFTFGFSQGITRDLVIQVSEFLGVAGDQVTNLDGMLTKMYAIFREKDATLLEIAPLARLENGLFASLDAKLIIDDDAAKRQPDIFRLRDTSQEVEDEVKAEKHSLVYVKMNGNIGNIVNGAGLAMATNDAIGLHGGTSANFLDAGGQATKETMIQAFGIVLGDERVKAILINIYGGITRCDMIAESIIGAAQEMTLSVPLVVRLQGTNSAEGLKLLADAKLGLHVESDFGRAAQRAVELAARL